MNTKQMAFVTRWVNGEEIETREIVTPTFVRPVVSITGLPELKFYSERGDVLEPADVVLIKEAVNA